MNRYSVVAIILAIASGIFLGISYMKNKYDNEKINLRKEHQKELAKQRDSLSNEITKRQQVISKLESDIKADSVKIQGLYYKIELDGLKTEQKRKEAKNFTHDEKRQWILSRYSKK